MPYFLFDIEMDQLLRANGNIRKVDSTMIQTKQASLINKLAGWQSGHAAACKAAYVGSIPAPASR